MQYARGRWETTVLIRLIFLCILQLVLSTSAFAQNVNTFIKIFQGATQGAVIHEAQVQWEKLPPNEIACIEQALRLEDATIDDLINRGVTPSDPRLSQLLSNCHVQVGQESKRAEARPEFARREEEFYQRDIQRNFDRPVSGQPSPYVVDELALYGAVRFESQVYQQYHCSPSNQNPDFTWCHKEQHEKSERGEIISSNSILHRRDRTAVYVNRYVEPAFFAGDDIKDELDRLSTRFGERARVMQMPRRDGFPSAVIAVWGKIQLEPLDANDVSIVASGQSLRKGYLVSFLGDIQHSAKLGLPVYRLGGGAGYLWSASYDNNGRGNLRFLTIDASRLSSRPASTPPVPNPPSPPPANTETRIALIVGNSGYRNVPGLDNPANDARLMADTLRSLGFKLVGGGPHIDLDKAGLDQAVQSFGHGLQGGDVGLFYYAGHGVEVRGANYLVPINANPTKETDVDFQMLDMKLVLSQMEEAGTKLNIVILDACRNNPFGGRGLRATTSGLAPMRAPQGTLISYATQPNNVAQDGNDGHSPYTKALVGVLRKPGLGIFETFNAGGLKVLGETGGSQQPWVSNSPIAGSFYFAGTATHPIVNEMRSGK